jgi:threonine dehydratase
MDLPTADDVGAAAERLRGVAVRTPLVQSELLDARIGGRAYLKPEPLQRTGSFKFRGAYNTVAQLEARAVVAYSSGNHAQGVAAAARLCGLPATIVMPANAPAIKIARTRAHGAEVRLYDRDRENREAIAEEIAARTGAALIRPYDDPRIIAGQGTAGLEAAEDLRALGITPDLAVVCCGGGGLVAGVGLALRDACPEIRVFTAEPVGFDSMARSLAAGTRVATPPGARSICDALLAPIPGEMTFAINHHQLAGGIAVTDDEVRDAMAFAFEELKLVVEPGGAVALAAILAGHLDVRGATILVVLSGGNVDPAVFAEAIGHAAPEKAQGSSD